MSVFEGLWSLTFILVMSLLIFQAAISLAGLAERLVAWFRGWWL